MNGRIAKREPLMDQDYFDRNAEYDTATLARFESKLAAATKAPPANRARFAYSIFRKRYENLVLRYSRGEEIAGIKKEFPGVVEAWERYLNMEGHQSPAAFDQDIDSYVRALWLISLAIIFNASADLIVRLLACIDNDGQDKLYERLVATRVPGRPAAQRLVFPKPYEPLCRAIDAPVEQKATLIRDFLKIWYPSLREAYWHDNHKGADGGGFFGYWCIEAAGVIKAFGIDDSPFRDMPYYPKDLVEGG